eukprot:5108665-Amphidinium_carterae.1
MTRAHRSSTQPWHKVQHQHKMHHTLSGNPPRAIWALPWLMIYNLCTKRVSRSQVEPEKLQNHEGELALERSVKDSCHAHS